MKKDIKSDESQRDKPKKLKRLWSDIDQKIHSWCTDRSEKEGKVIVAIILIVMMSGAIVSIAIDFSPTKERDKSNHLKIESIKQPIVDPNRTSTTLIDSISNELNYYLK